jgi:hypothetical protein
MVKKKVELNRNFYVDEIGVLDWLYDENIYQKIRLEREDCFKYKYNNQLHREDGPAIETIGGVGDQYYLFGDKVTWEEFINNNRYNNIDKCLNEKPSD